MQRVHASLQLRSLGKLCTRAWLRRPLTVRPALPPTARPPVPFPPPAHQVRDLHHQAIAEVYGFSSERKMASVLVKRKEGYRLYNKVRGWEAGDRGVWERRGEEGGQFGGWQGWHRVMWTPALCTNWRPHGCCCRPLQLA